MALHHCHWPKTTRFHTPIGYNNLVNPHTKISILTPVTFPSTPNSTPGTREQHPTSNIHERTIHRSIHSHYPLPTTHANANANNVNTMTIMSSMNNNNMTNMNATPVPPVERTPSTSRSRPARATPPPPPPATQEHPRSTTRMFQHDAADVPPPSATAFASHVQATLRRFQMDRVIACERVRAAIGRVQARTAAPTTAPPMPTAAGTSATSIPRVVLPHQHMTLSQLRDAMNNEYASAQDTWRVQLSLLNGEMLKTVHWMQRAEQEKNDMAQRIERLQADLEMARQERLMDLEINMHRRRLVAFVNQYLADAKNEKPTTAPLDHPSETEEQRQQPQQEPQPHDEDDLDLDRQINEHRRKLAAFVASHFPQNKPVHNDIIMDQHADDTNEDTHEHANDNDDDNDNTNDNDNDNSHVEHLGNTEHEQEKPHADADRELEMHINLCHHEEMTPSMHDDSLATKDQETSHAPLHSIAIDVLSCSEDEEESEHLGHDEDRAVYSHDNDNDDKNVILDDANDVQMDESEYETKTDNYHHEKHTVEVEVNLNEEYHKRHTVEESDDEDAWTTVIPDISFYENAQLERPVHATVLDISAIPTRPHQHPHQHASAQHPHPYPHQHPDSVLEVLWVVNVDEDMDIFERTDGLINKPLTYARPPPWTVEEERQSKPREHADLVAADDNSGLSQQKSHDISQPASSTSTSTSTRTSTSTSTSTSTPKPQPFDKRSWRNVTGRRQPEDVSVDLHHQLDGGSSLIPACWYDFHDFQAIHGFGDFQDLGTSHDSHDLQAPPSLPDRADDSHDLGVCQRSHSHSSPPAPAPAPAPAPTPTSGNVEHSHCTMSDWKCVMQRARANVRNLARARAAGIHRPRTRATTAGQREKPPTTRRRIGKSRRPRPKHSKHRSRQSSNTMTPVATAAATAMEASVAIATTESRVQMRTKRLRVHPPTSHTARPTASSDVDLSETETVDTSPFPSPRNHTDACAADAGQCATPS